ncbi:hypothetical protein FB451DRAFT_1411556 [Mycena latifolia]|nr:hypothetical protein FB451DRAFT_1411556 [Mycena latifolia]
MTSTTEPASNATTRAQETFSAQPASPQGFSLPPGTVAAPTARYYTFVPYPVAASTPPVDATVQAGAVVQATPVAPVPAALPAVANIPNPHIVTGIPPGLASLLRWTGPWSTNIIYSVAPTGPLVPIDEPIPTPEWYCITCGHFVGVIDQYAMAHYGIHSISNTAHKSYTTQAYALDAFNKVVTWGGIEVI